MPQKIWVESRKLSELTIKKSRGLKTNPGVFSKCKQESKIFGEEG